MLNNKLTELRSATTRCPDCPVRKKALFQVVSDAYLEDAEKRRTAQYKLQARGHLYHENQSASMAFTLFDGWLLQYRNDSDGSRQGLRVALPGDFVGYVPGEDAQYSHSALAVTDVIACGFRQSDLHEMIASHSDIGHQITNIQARYLSHCETNVLGLGRKSAEQRIAHTFADLYHRLDLRGEVDRETLSMPFPLTQEMLGELNGLTPVHTNRVLRKLRLEGIVRAERQRVEILNLDKLMELGDYRA
ncbi:Crp/Fnr family transcriptional regulator [Thiosocius teredinicola]|uniref:Crp/Fnr family transcriptional regulator n=1 Tax=Thiosocius teredinicola TaxID=1973002 RepID=UPI0013DD9533